MHQPVSVFKEPELLGISGCDSGHPNPVLLHPSPALLLQPQPSSPPRRDPAREMEMGTNPE